MTPIRLIPQVSTRQGISIHGTTLDLYPVTREREAIRRLRRAARLNLLEVAERLGISPIEVGDLLRGKTQVHPEDWSEVIVRLLPDPAPTLLTPGGAP